MATTKQVRTAFRAAVFRRDRYRCVMCGRPGKDRQDGHAHHEVHGSVKDLVDLDAHHITDRNDMPNGGYVAENGISLCAACHLWAEIFHTPREDDRCTVTMMSGLPRSGKDTWLTRCRPNLPVVSLDDIRTDLNVDATENQGEVIQAARESSRDHLRAGRDFAFNATNTMRQTRKRWIDLFVDYNARIELVYVEPPLSSIFEQNERRTRPVPRQVIERLVAKLEPPTVTEAHAIVLAG